MSDRAGCARRREDTLSRDAAGTARGPLLPQRAANVRSVDALPRGAACAGRSGSGLATYRRPIAAPPRGQRVQVRGGAGRPASAVRRGADDRGEGARISRRTASARWLMPGICRSRTPTATVVSIREREPGSRGTRPHLVPSATTTPETSVAKARSAGVINRVCGADRPVRRGSHGRSPVSSARWHRTRSRSSPAVLTARSSSPGTSPASGER
jgi:hypothetical protein